MLFDLDDNELLPEIDEYDHPGNLSESDTYDLVGGL
ncbi:hypothetical protein VPHD528_0167 [Vibrio phage D528]